MSLYKYNLGEFNFKLNEFIHKHFSSDKLEKLQYMLEEGKRIRPILGLAFNSLSSYLYDKMIIVEIIHNISLIIDDTPQMDNDISRRDKSTFHIKYGCKETYLFTYYIMGWINKYIAKFYAKTLDHNKNSIIYSHITSIYDELLSLIQGQYKDIRYSSNIKTSNLLTYKSIIPNKYEYTFNILHTQINTLSSNISNESNESNESNKSNESNELNESNKSNESNELNKSNKSNELDNYIILVLEKTSSLFWLPIYLAIYDNNILDDNIQYNNISSWSYIFGLYFQISDDILDVNDDKHKDKPNICNYIDNAKYLQCELHTYLKISLETLQYNMINYNLINELLEMICNK